MVKGAKSPEAICDCILGVVLIGPSIDTATCATIFAALRHYRTALPRLWALSEAGRLLAIRLQPLPLVQQGSNSCRPTSSGWRIPSALIWLSFVLRWSRVLRG